MYFVQFYTYYKLLRPNFSPFMAQNDTDTGFCFYLILVRNVLYCD
jgi:hypothetical protein